MDNMAIASKGEIKAKPRGRPIQKGQVLNPTGRPKIPEDIKDACKAASIEAIGILLSLMRSEDTNAGERIKAATTILNRAWGTPAQSVEISNKDGEQLSLKIEYVSKAQ
jgi:hypothetical protein